MRTGGTIREATERPGTGREFCSLPSFLPRSPASPLAAGRPQEAGDDPNLVPAPERPRAPLPEPLLGPLGALGPDEKRAVETVCAEMGLTRSCERAIAEIFVANLRSVRRLDQLEQVQFSESYSTTEDLAKLKMIAVQKLRLQRGALEAFQLLVSTRLPQITILAGQAQVNVAGGVGR